MVQTEAVGACGLVGHRLVLESRTVAASASVELAYEQEVLRM